MCRRSPREIRSSLGCVVLTLLLLFFLLPSAHCEEEVTPLSAAIVLGQSIESPYWSCYELAQIASSGTSINEKEGSIKLLDQLSQQSVKLVDPPYWALAIEAIADAYIVLGEMDLAIATHEQLGMTKDRISSILRMTDRLRYQEKFMERDQLLAHIKKSLPSIELTDQGERDQFLAHVAINFAENDQVEVALKIANSISDNERQEAALIEVAIGSMPFQSPKQVLEICDGIDDQSRRTRGILALIKYLGEAGRPEEALNCLSRLEKDPIWEDRARAYIVISFAKAGQIAESEKHLAEIKEGYALSLATQTLAPELAKHGQITKAEAYANSITIKPYRAEVWAAIGGACLSLGKDDLAMNFFQQANAIEQSLDDPFAKVPLLKHIAKAAAEHGKLDYALEITQSMTGKGIQLTDKWDVLSMLAWKYFEVGQTEQAIKVAKLIGEKTSREIALAYIADGLAAKGQKDAALKLANQLPEGAQKQNAFQMIASDFAHSGDFQAALDLVEKMTDPICKTRALSSIASSTAKFQHVQTIAELEMLRRIIHGAKRGH